MALLQAIEMLLLEEEEKNPGSVFDHDFIEKKTVGFDDFISHLQQQNMDELVKSSGIDLAQIKETADVIKR